MSGSGSAPQLDEAKPPRSLMNMLKREAQKSARNMVTPALVEAFAVEVVDLLRRTGYTILTAEEYSELNSRYLAACSGAGELDLTDAELARALMALRRAQILCTDGLRAGVVGASFEQVGAKGQEEWLASARWLRARLDRKDDEA